MEKEIRDRFNKAVLAEARQRYAIAAEQITLLDGFESFMYEYTQDSSAYILRLGHSRRRSPEMIRGEVDWINYLAAGGVRVARAVLSANGNLVEEISDGQGGAFLATGFVKAAGGPVWRMGGWTDELLVRYGRLLGRIHHLSKRYTPHPNGKRGTWQDESNLGLEKIIPAEETAVVARYHEVITHLTTLSQTPDSYGMIHQDAHAGNLFVDEQGNITLFDFDDCCYGHFAYDLAMVLFYAITNRPEPEKYGSHFWQHFLAGYYQENNLDHAWLREVPHFMKLREIDLFANISRDFDGLAEDSWVQSFMRLRKERIEAGVPYVQMEFDIER